MRKGSLLGEDEFTVIGCAVVNLKKIHAALLRRRPVIQLKLQQYAEVSEEVVSSK